MRKHLAAVGLFLALAITGVVTLTLTSNDTTPVRGKGLHLSCLTSGESASGSLIWLNPQNVKLSTCFTTLNGCSGNTSSYSFTIDNSGGYAYINSLSRETDSGTWKCVYGVVTTTIEIKVYTIPSGLSITQNPDQDVDLSVNSAVLQCITVGCAYPMSTIRWIFKDQTTSSETEYAAVSAAGTQETCTSSEMVYTSALLIYQYTTFSDNSGKTGTFFCRIEYPDPSRNIISSLSKNIIFAVNLTSVNLKDSNQSDLSHLVTFVNGTAVTLVCITSTSWPAATVSWFIDTMQITSGIKNSVVGINGLKYVESRMTLTPSNTDHHNKMIYCQAYTINKNYFQQSFKSLMYVKVQVEGITMHYGSSAVVLSVLPLVDGVSITVYCQTTLSRPASIIIWYKGDSVVRDGVTTTNLTSNGLDFVRSYLTLTPTNIDHGLYIYCQAYNLDSIAKVTSIRATVQVKGAPRIPDISPDYKGYIGQYTIIQFGVYSNRDENLTITAQHYNTSGLIQQGIIQKVLPDSLKMYSSPEPDFRATIAIIVRNEYDFGQYLVNVTNNVGLDLKIIRIDEQITPEKPMNFHATNIQERQLSLMWQSGYHGKFPQTFVVETSKDNITWTNVSLVSDGNRDEWFTTVIENLNPGSKYFFRLYGYNKNGRGEFADEQLAVRMWKECLYTSSIMDSASVGLSVGGAVGIGVGGVVLGCIGAIIAFTIRRQLNGSKSSCFSRKGKMDDGTHTYSNTEMTSQPIKPIYEELRQRSVEHNMLDRFNNLMWKVRLGLVSSLHRAEFYMQFGSTTHKYIM